MAKIISIKCPECGGVLEVHEGSPFYFCSYCGTKVLVDDGNKTETYRKVDEARIKEAETAQTVRLREIELEERKLKLKMAPGGGFAVKLSPKSFEIFGLEIF